MLKNVSFCFLKFILVLVNNYSNQQKNQILRVASLEKVIHFCLILLENIHTP